MDDSIKIDTNKDREIVRVTLGRFFKVNESDYKSQTFTEMQVLGAMASWREIFGLGRSLLKKPKRFRAEKMFFLNH